MGNRVNRWVRTEALRDIERICAARVGEAGLIRQIAAWIIEQLAVEPSKKGEMRTYPDGIKTYRRWTVGPITAIFSVLPEADKTVIVEGFLPA